MGALLGHGSGWDEILLFLAAPALYLLYRGVMRLLGRAPPEPVEPDLPEDAGEPRR